MKTTEMMTEMMTETKMINQSGEGVDRQQMCALLL